MPLGEDAATLMRGLMLSHGGVRVPMLGFRRIAAKPYIKTASMCNISFPLNFPSFPFHNLHYSRRLQVRFVPGLSGDNTLQPLTSHFWDPQKRMPPYHSCRNTILWQLSEQLPGLAKGV